MIQRPRGVPRQRRFPRRPYSVRIRICRAFDVQPHIIMGVGGSYTYEYRRTHL